MLLLAVTVKIISNFSFWYCQLYSIFPVISSSDYSIARNNLYAACQPANDLQARKKGEKK